MGKISLKEDFTMKKPDIGHLRIFGYLVYCHVLVEKRMKLESTAKNGIFIGYSETPKSYRVYIPSLKKTVVRRM